MKIRWSAVSAALAVVVLAGCASSTEPQVAVLQGDMLPPMRWDFHPEGEAWTRASLAMLETDASALTQIVPADIEIWCPGYADADADGRAAFWAGLVSTLARHESTWNPTAVGGGGRWFGLVQITPATARGYGCAVGTGTDLLDGEANLRCGLRIMSETVPRDGVVSAGMRGVAADWGPFHQGTKREDMRAWVSSQDYCQPSDS
jgi:hypothetical protein